MWRKFLFNGGLVTSRDRTDLQPGELQVAQGCFYKRGDATGLHKLKGRTDVGSTGTTGRVKGLALCQFDGEGQDALISLSGTTLSKQTPGATGDFVTIDSGMDSAATSLGSSHYNDSWYQCNGHDRNWVIEADGTKRDMGMYPSPEPLTVTLGSNVTSASRPATESGAWESPALAVDSDNATYAYATAVVGGTVTHTWSGFAASTSGDRYLSIVWGLMGVNGGITGGGGTGSSGFGDDRFDDFGGGGGGLGENSARVIIESSSNNGGVFVELYSQILYSPEEYVATQIPINVDSGNWQVRISLVHVTGGGPVTLRAYDIRITESGNSPTFTTDASIYYSFSEYDSNRGLISPAAEWTEVVFAANNSATLTFPPQVNPNATHRIVWRTPDLALPDISRLGRVPGLIPIDKTTMRDEFDEPKDVQLRPTYPTLQVSTVGGGTLLYDRDTPPPVFNRIRQYKGSFVGIPLGSRAIYYSLPGFPDSYPSINVITAFPLDENDRLVDCLEVGDDLIVAAEGAMIRLTDLPRIVNGTFNASAAIKIRNAEGCVGPNALAPITQQGEPGFAWISPYGINRSNGVLHTRLTNEIDFSQFDGEDMSEFGLHWDAREQIIYFYTPSNGYWLIHADPSHGGKVTGPHQGSISSMASGQVENSHFIYSGHATDGRVYRERDGGVDASTASGVHSMIVKGHRMDGEGTSVAVLKAKLNHTSANRNETIEVDYLSGNYDRVTENIRSSSLPADKHGETLFDIAREGEWAEVTITHNGAGLPSLRKLELELRDVGEVGQVTT